MSAINLQSDGEDSLEEQSVVAFDKTVSALMCQFVDAVSKLQSLTGAPDTSYRLAVNTIQEIVEGIIISADTFKQVKDLITDLTFGHNHKFKFKQMGLDFDVWDFPIPARICSDHIMALTRKEVLKVVEACQEYNKNKAALHHTLVPCMRAVKKLRIFYKELLTCHEMRELAAKTRKTLLSADSVSSLFKLWDTQEQGRRSSTSTSDSTSQHSSKSDTFLVIVDSKVKGGKLEKLVDFLISHEPEIDPEYIPAFIMTLHSFTTAPALLDMLIEQYEMLQMFQDQSLVQIKLKSIKLTRICSVLLYWINNHFVEDFKDFKFLIMRLQTFVITMIKPDFETIGSVILISLNQNVRKINVAKL